MTDIISKKDYIAQVFDKYPVVRRAFIDRKMRCFACDMMKFATVEECCSNHKIKDVEGFVSTLNKYKSTTNTHGSEVLSF